jgi:hypothetical protein
MNQYDALFLYLIFLPHLYIFRAIFSPSSGGQVCVRCPECIRPFWIYREPVTWCWCNLGARKRGPYCTFVSSHSSVGLVGWQWDALDWSCVLCDRRIQNYGVSRSASSRQCASPLYSSRADFFFGKKSHHPGLSAPYSSDLVHCNFWLIPKLK